MIKLQRERTPRAITATLRGKNRVKKAMILLEGIRNQNLSFNSTNSYWKKAKKQLKLESFGKCAYCEVNTEVVAYGDVEHFRPKSLYWWLAYTYDNYLYCCQICNQSYKGDNFPIHGQRMRLAAPLPATFPEDIAEEELTNIAALFGPDPLNDHEGYPMARFVKAAIRERPGLIDPYLIDPEPFFKWTADPVLKEVRVNPRNNSTAVKRSFEAVDSFLGLNRVELLRVRWTAYETLETLKDVLQSGEFRELLMEKVKRQLREMTSDSAPFAAMARYFVNNEWSLDL